MKKNHTSAQLDLLLDEGAIASNPAAISLNADVNSQVLVVASWNVNSIRARLEHVLQWLQRVQPDVLCLQEIKVVEEQFPKEPFTQLGYNLVIHGQKQRNGVAILSRYQLQGVQLGLDEELDLETEARIVTALIRGIRVASIYAPNAHSVNHQTFLYKIQWMDKLAKYVRRLCDNDEHVLLCGDFNVAPRNIDVHDPSLWLYQTFVHPDARLALMRVTAEKLIDVHLSIKGSEAGYTWWDYRGDAVAHNHGMRIDHIYATRPLAACCTDVIVDIKARKEEKPSDHASILARFDMVALKCRNNIKSVKTNAASV